MSGAVATFPAGRVSARSGEKGTRAVGTPAADRPKSGSVAKPSRVQSRALKRRLARQALVLKASAVVIAALLSVSLSHIARGVCLITLVDAWQGWAMAVGIEAAYIVAELAVIFAATDKTRRQVAQWAGPFTIVAMVMSALLNAFAFAEHVTGMAKAVPVLIGVMMPVAIYTLTKLAVPLYLNGDR